MSAAKLFAVIFGAVLSAMLIGGGSFLWVRNNGARWLDQAAVHQAEMKMEISDIIARKEPAAQYATSRLLLKLREARLHMEEFHIGADDTELKLSCAGAVLLIDDYRKAHGLGPLTSEDY